MEYTLNLTAERSVVRESLKGILWTIFFNRLFGPIIPLTREFLTATYAIAENLPDLDSLIDEKINEFVKNFDESRGRGQGRSHGRGQPGDIEGREISSKSHLGSSLGSQPSIPLRKESGSPAHLIIQFLDKNSTKKKTGWFGKVDSSEYLKVWESWIIVVTCLPVQESPDNHDLSVRSFENNLHTIVDIVDTHKDHIPPITSLESSPFPYSIEIEPISLNYRTEGSNESWGKYIKKMLD